MSLSSIIDLSGATLGLFSGVFFCIGMLHIKNSTIENIATSFYGSGFTLANELVQQKSEFIFGAILLFLSFFVQVIGKFIPHDMAATVVAPSHLEGAALGFGGPTIVLLLIYISYRLHRTKVLGDFLAAVKDKV